MNAQDLNVLNTIINNGYSSQRRIAEITELSLGKVNSALHTLEKYGYLTNDFELTVKARKEIVNNKPRNAIILAAGFGMRMVPINNELPKGLIKIHGEPLIERVINQLHEIGVVDIDIVVGFMKEKYEYLIDKYGVNLVYNNSFDIKNNLHSLNLLREKISNTYIIPSDIWVEENPFANNELYSWYAVTETEDYESSVRINRKQQLVSIDENEIGKTMLGIAYLLEEEAAKVRDKLDEFSKLKKYDKAFWEDALFSRENRRHIYAKIFNANRAFEINTYEQLREIDENSDNLNSDIINLIASVMDVSPSEIEDIVILKKGMTNRSFRFSCRGNQYIMRVPGEGTDQLINRKEESDVYKVLHGKMISDDVLYISPMNGYKITKYWSNARVCDPFDLNDVRKCMLRLREFHEKELEVEHTFDIFKQIEFYERLWGKNKSIFRDYLQTKKNITSLKNLVDSLPKEFKLTHVDAVPDNFLFIEDGIRLIDWEYAGMQDPHLDIAMFAIYSMYDRANIEKLIDNYFIEGCHKDIRLKIYCYIAIGGLLWSNWCEYKRQCGVDFGEYSLRQYRYAKEYFKIVKEEIEKRTK